MTKQGLSHKVLNIQKSKVTPINKLKKEKYDNLNTERALNKNQTFLI